MLGVNKSPYLASLLNSTISATTEISRVVQGNREKAIQSGSVEVQKKNASGRSKNQDDGTKKTGKYKDSKDNSMVQNFLNRTIRFELVKELKTVVAKIVDKKTGKVIRQIPPEELIELAEQMSKGSRLLNKEA